MKGAFDILATNWKMILFEYTSKTLLLAAIAVILGTVIGAFLAFAQMWKVKPLKWIVVAIVEFVRGTPALLQIYLIYFVLPMMFPQLNRIDPMISAFICAAVALIFNSAAYVSEIIRSGIEAVDKGQTEAARSLGLTSTTTMMQIVLPQAIKNILPALGNEFITVVKETSLAATFFAGELMTFYKEYVGLTHDALPAFIVVGIVYFAVNFILSKSLKFAERRMKARA
jgi:His/Glu/Gln/Arg/opine family amino acid ABC transporter permease subunit